jgi:ketosteroid isomerase-like protein
MSDEYAISVQKTEFREAHNSGDVERLLSVFAPGFTDMSAAEPSFYGEEARAALRWRASNLFREYRVQMEVIIIAIVILGDTAYDYGWHSLTLTPKAGGDQLHKRSRYCEIWRRQPDGAWKIALFIDNEDQASQMLPAAATA